jgi:hypothetical protein
MEKHHARHIWWRFRLIIGLRSMPQATGRRVPWPLRDLIEDLLLRPRDVTFISCVLEDIMHQVTLEDAYFPIQDSQKILETTVGGLLRETASTSPAALALVEVDGDGGIGRQWTYHALLSDAERLALALSTRFAPGERLCVWAPNVPEWVLLEYACGLAGLTLVTANPAYQVSELRCPSSGILGQMAA